MDLISELFSRLSMIMGVFGFGQVCFGSVLVLENIFSICFMLDIDDVLI